MQVPSGLPARRHAARGDRFFRATVMLDAAPTNTMRLSRSSARLGLSRALLVLSIVGASAGANACSSRQVTMRSAESDTDASADASLPIATSHELCEHYEKCAASFAARHDGGTFDSGLGKADASTSAANGETCNRAREALFQQAPAPNCGCTYANECPGSSCDPTTGECADSPRAVCRQYCANATYVDKCDPESCAKFCTDFMPPAKEKCRTELAAFLSCAESKMILGARCATYILAPSFPVPTACDAEYKTVSDCVY